MANADKALWAALDDRDSDKLQAALRAGALPNTKNKAGTTPLAAALDTRSAALATLLLDAGADPRIQSEGTRLAPLQNACFYGFLDIVDRIVAAGVDINGDDVDSPLAQAVDAYLYPKPRRTGSSPPEVVIERLRAMGARVDATTLRYLKEAP